MGSSLLRYRVNADHVAHQMIDEEVVILNLERGHYYSLVGTAAEIWDRLGRGATLSDVVDDLRARYADPEGAIEPKARAFLDELVSEELAVTEPVDGRNGPRPDPDLDASPARPSFETPAIEKYTDLEDLLVLDPVHDVDETGWPTPWR